MGIDASKLSTRIKSLVEAREKKFRRLMCEGLERRELMAFSVLGTDMSDLTGHGVVQKDWSGVNNTAQDTNNQQRMDWLASGVMQSQLRPYGRQFAVVQHGANAPRVVYGQARTSC